MPTQERAQPKLLLFAKRFLSQADLLLGLDMVKPTLAIGRSFG